MNTKRKSPRDFDQLISSIKLSEPWQGQLYAITLAIFDKGIFTKQEFMLCFRKNLNKMVELQSFDYDDDFFLVWLASLESIIIDLKFGLPVELNGLKNKWRTAFLNAQHGKPVKFSSYLNRAEKWNV